MELNAQTKELHNWLNANNIIAELDYLTSEVRLKQYAHVISSTTAEFTQHEKEIEDLKTEINGLIKEYEATIETDVDRQYYEAACAAWEKYLDATGDKFISLSRAMRLDEANAIMLGDGFDAFSEFQVHFDTLLEYNHAQAEEVSDRATSVFIFIVALVIVLVAIATLIAINVSRVIIKGIVTPVDELKYTAGNLTKDFKQITDFRGEFGSIKASFVRILKEFNITLGKIREGAMDVDTGSDEIAGAAGDLATGTGEQASAVEEVAARATEMTSQIQKFELFD